MAKKIIPEILDLVSAAKTKQDKINIIKEYNHPALRDILRINFDLDVVSLLPEGAPPYRKDDAPAGHSVSSLHRGYRQFKYFFKGPIGNQVLPAKRESLFINLLESMHPSESELLIQCKDRKYTGMSAALVTEIYPKLLVKAAADKKPAAKKPAAKKATKTKKEK